MFVSTASIFIRFAQTEASSLVIAASRLVIATLILGPLAFMRHWDAIGSLSRRDFFKALLSGTFLAFHFAAWISSLQYTTVASSVVLVTTTPLWVALLSPLVLREPIRKMVIFGLILSVTGGMIVGLGNACDVAGGKLVCDPLVFTSRIMLGNGLALFGAWMAAGYMLIGRQIRKQLNTVPYTALVYGVAALILVVVVLLRGDPFWTYSEEIYLWLLALGIFPQLLGHSLFNWSLKYISAAYVSLTLLGEPIGTIILAFFFLKESLTLLEGVGALLILIGILVGSLGRKTRSSAA